MTGRALVRAAMTLLAVNQVVVGTWAALAPRSFFDQFPLGRGWVASLPPFNEHLVRDVGGLSLGFAVLFAIAAIHANPALVRPVLFAWLVPASAHLVFHLDHLRGFSGPDARAQSAGLALAAFLPAAVLWMTRSDGAPDHDSHAVSRGGRGSPRSV